MWNYTSGYSVIKATATTGSNTFVNKTAIHPYHTGSDYGKKVLNVIQVIGPLASQNISGAFSGQFQARSSASGEIFQTYLVLNALTSSGTMLKTLSSGAYGQVYNTTIGQNRTSNNPTGILSPYFVFSGQYLSVEIGAISLNSGAGAPKYWQRLCSNQSTDLTINNTDTTLKNSWISFKNNITLI